MKILLVYPSSGIPFKGDNYPLGLLYLAGALEKDNHKILVKNYYGKDWDKSKDEIISVIKDYSPDILGLSCSTMNRTSCFKISKIAKEINPNMKIIMGGVHATSTYKQILENFPVDAILLGEGEISIPKLVGALGENKSLKNVNGIAFKDKGKVYVNPRLEFITNLDELPIPRHELFVDNIKETGEAIMITSRGCPFNCIFCSTTEYWGRRWRPRSAKNVVDEMEYIIKNVPEVKKIRINDDTFLLDNQRVIDICNEMQRRNIKIRWWGWGRLDVITKEMLLKLKESGFENIGYGVESGSTKMLKVMNKQITKEQIKRAIKITNEVGLKYHIFLMVGNPGETWETVKESSDFLKELENLKIENVGKLQIYPNTQIYELAKKQGIIDDSFWLTDKTIPLYTAEHSEDELTKMAYYIVAKNQLRMGLFHFIVFCLKFLIKKPKKAIKYAFLKNKWDKRTVSET